MQKTDKRKKFQVSAIVLALAGMPLFADAAGLGKLTIHSALGQPLRAEIEVSATRDELNTISARVASADQFRQQGIEYSAALSTLRFTFDKRANGDAVLRLSSDRPLNEPFLDMLVELNWASGRLVREYTFLLDPPDLPRKSVATVPVSAPVVAPTKVEASPVVQPTTPAAAVIPAIAKETTPAAAPLVEQKKAQDVAPEPEKVAPQPASVTNNVATESAKQAKTRKVKKGETLAKIAEETKPESVSLDQMLVALFVENKAAFDGGNLNRLKAGRILDIPDTASASAITPTEAKKTVATQSENFNAYRRKLAAAAAERAAAKEASVSQKDAGKIAPKVEDKAPNAALNKDKLEVSRADTAKAAATEADRVAREKALSDANMRVAALEKNVADLKRMNEISSKSGADAQKQAQAQLPAPAKVEPKAAPTPAPAAVPPAAAAKPADAAVKPAEQAKPINANQSAVATTPADAAKPAEMPKEGEAPKPAIPPKPKKVIPPPPPPEPDFLEENGPLVFGGGGVIAALLGLLGFRAWRRKRDAAAEQQDTASQFGDSGFASNSVFGQTGGQSVDTNVMSLNSDFSHSGPEGVASAEAVDPVAEADVYMAYGRDAQAEEILQEALKQDPTRTEVQLKLLEVYAGRKSLTQFATVAKTLHSNTGGTGDVWAKAAALGLSIDPTNALYGGVAAAVEPAVELPIETKSFGATTVVMPSGELAQLAKLAEDAGAELPADLDMPAPLDFDLDLGETPAEGVTASSTALDFDLDSGAVSNELSSAPTLDIDLQLPEVSAGINEVADAPDNGLDFDLGSDSETLILDASLSLQEAPAATKTAVKEADDTSIDFSFTLDTPADTAAAEAPTFAAPEPELSAPNFDLSAINLDLDVSTVAAPEPESIANLGAEPPVADANENPEVATKLELAQAYEEMGDKEGVRELLQEVLAEGSPAQQEVARQKLALL